ncbi:MAG: ABC transporter ATP-binding protein/permease [Bdellovibrionaceae bacterium]|nr:ABC transporter ATP-binding protein/permease [Pseudobdellovibrionaceae bacterium]
MKKYERSTWDTVKSLTEHLWPKNRGDLKWRVVLAMACLLIAKVINVYVPFLYKDAVDALSPQNIALILPLGIIISYGLARIGQQTFGELRDFFFAKVSQHAQRTVALSTFSHLHQLSLAFHLDRQTGGLTRVIERGIRAIQTVLSFMLFNIGPTLLEILLVVVILYKKFGPMYAAITFVAVGLYVYFTFAITNWRIQFRKSMNDRDSEANTKAIDSLLNYETVKYFGNEEHEYRRYDISLEQYQAEALRSQWSLSLLNVGQGVIIGIGLVGIMWLAADGVINKVLTVGDFVLVNTLLLQLFIPLGFLGFVYREVSQGLTDMEKMFELLEVHSEIKDAPEAKVLQSMVADGKWTIEFDHVNFQYNADRQILKDVSFKVAAGKTTAIVGPSGSGKSTIARLLFRFYDVTDGSIKIGGQDLRSATQKSVRQSLGIVPQDTVLFNDSIGYNIHYGNPTASDAEVHKAAGLAQIESFIESLPTKYKTPVGERGLKLSGGEKQRVSIARAVLKNPPIMLFDEATSALDSHTEKEIQKSLHQVSQNRTTLMIAHRLSTVVDADEILVLKAGVIAERGRHAELLQRNGEYAAMWKKQQEAQEYQEKLERIQE